MERWQNGNAVVRKGKQQMKRAESRIRPVVGGRNSAGEIVQKFRNWGKQRNREQEKWELREEAK